MIGAKEEGCRIASSDRDVSYTMRPIAEAISLKVVKALQRRIQCHHGSGVDAPPGKRKGTCAKCGKPSGWLCGTCCRSFYCGFDCLKTDRNQHRIECTPSKGHDVPAEINVTPPNNTAFKKEATPTIPVTPINPAFQQERNKYKGHVLSKSRDSAEINDTPPNKMSFAKEQSQTAPVQAKCKAFFEIGERVKVNISYAVSLTEFFVTKSNQEMDLANLHKGLNATVLDSSPSINPALNAKCVMQYEGQWSRAKVLSLNPLQVFFVDFGNVEGCNLLDLKALPEKFCSILPFAAKVFCADGLTPAELATECFDVEVIKKEQNGRWIVEIVRDSAGGVKSPRAIYGNNRPIETEKINLASSGAMVDERKRLDSEHSHQNQKRMMNGQTKKTEQFPDERFQFTKKDETKAFPRQSGKSENTPVIFTARTETNSTPRPVAISGHNSKHVADFFTCGEEVVVFVSHLVSKNEFWVSKIKDGASLLKLQADLNANVSTTSPPALSILNEMCVMKYEEEWCRARVVSLRPLKVFFIDYGNTENCTQADLKALPLILDSVPPFACKVFLADGLDKGEVENPFTIEVIKKNHIDGWVAKVVRKNAIESQKDNRGAPEQAATAASYENRMQVIAPNSQGAPEAEFFKVGELVKNGKETSIKVQATGPVADGCVMNDPCVMGVVTRIPGAETNIVQRVPPAKTNTSSIVLKEQLSIYKRPQLKNIIEMVDNSTFACLQVTDVKNDRLISATAAAKNIATEETKRILDMYVDTPYDPSYRPDRGEMVAVPHLESWARGVVISAKDSVYFVDLLDFSNTTRVKEVKRLPVELRDCPQLGVQLSLYSTPSESLAIDDTLYIKFINRTEEARWIVEVKKENSQVPIGCGELTSWTLGDAEGYMTVYHDIKGFWPDQNTESSEVYEKLLHEYASKSVKGQ